jgi:hypothetical protein
MEFVEPVQEQIESELELELVITAGADHGMRIVGPAGRDGDDVRQQLGQLLRHGRPRFRVADV